MKHQARKRFGQHFLTNLDYLDKMVDVIAAGHHPHIIEIGPGKGALTEGLLKSTPKLDVIEIDRDLSETLQRRWGSQENFQLFTEDVLEFDFSPLIKGPTPVCIVGNLPYNISTPLLFKLFKFYENIASMYFLLQKEVVDRIVALPGTKTYGRLSVMTQYHCAPQSLFDVPSNAFSPPPRVQSAYLALLPKKKSVKANSLSQLQIIVRAAFNQRRKMIGNSIKHLVSEADLQAIGIDPKQRPENLSVEEFVHISNINPENTD